MSLIILGTVILICTYLFCSFTIVRQSERAIKCGFGHAYKVVGPGLRFTPLGIVRLIKFPTARQEVQFKTKIMSAKTTEHSAAEVKVKISFRFYWPRPEEKNRDDLISSWETFGTLKPNEILDILTEPILDIAETVAAKMDWRELYTNRPKFTEETQKLLNHLPEDNVIRQAKLRSPRILLVDVDLPTNLKETLTKPEIARLVTAAKIQTAKGEKEALATAKPVLDRLIRKPKTKTKEKK